MAEKRIADPTVLVDHAPAPSQSASCIALQSPLGGSLYTCVPPASPATQLANNGGRIPWATIFAGISFKLYRNKATIAIAYHDGHFNIDFTVQHVNLYTCEDVTQTIVRWLCEYSEAHSYKIIGVGIDHAAVDPDQGGCELLPHQVWLEMDVLPFIFHFNGGGNHHKESRHVTSSEVHLLHNIALHLNNRDPNSAEHELEHPAELDERADSASRKCAMMFGFTLIPRMTIGFRNEVLVDCDGLIQFATLRHYRDTVSGETWKSLMHLATTVKERHLRVSFFNATPQGGGVALMRHASIRFLKLLGIDASWFVPKPNPSVFRITKDMHNILQGVAGKDVKFDEECEEMYTEWIALNCERYWMNGPFQTSDVIVLDDPQVLGYVPFIRRANPDCKIIFRSHIEIRSELTCTEGTSQQRVWNFLAQYLEQVDLFVSHPMPQFIPKTVPREKVVLMPASTDPLDGLNKPMSAHLQRYYMQIFNRMCLDQMGNHLLTAHRPYIIQISRFDPSKGKDNASFLVSLAESMTRIGIEDVLEAYRLLREQMDPEFALRMIPQLVICGHGSVDDPDATIVYEKVIRIIQQDEYMTIRHDICLCRLPPSDPLLNALLRSASVALQLSHREGFEVKVTEALAKGIPIIAYRAGGIPLQIQDGHGGYLVEIGDTKKVAHLLLQLLQDRELRARMSQEAVQSVTEEYWTVFQTANWLSLFLEVTELKENRRVQRWYQQNGEKFLWAKQLWMEKDMEQ